MICCKIKGGLSGCMNIKQLISQSLKEVWTWSITSGICYNKLYTEISSLPNFASPMYYTYNYENPKELHVHESSNA